MITQPINVFLVVWFSGVWGLACRTDESLYDLHQ